MSSEGHWHTDKHPLDMWLISLIFRTYFVLGSVTKDYVSLTRMSWKKCGCPFLYTNKWKLKEVTSLSAISHHLHKVRTYFPMFFSSCCLHLTLQPYLMAVVTLLSSAYNNCALHILFPFPGLPCLLHHGFCPNKSALPSALSSSVFSPSSW